MFSIVWEAYSFVEIFAGAGWVSTCMRDSGKATCSLDILAGEPLEGKQNPWDLLSDAGFSFLTLQTVLGYKIFSE